MHQGGRWLPRPVRLWSIRGIAPERGQVALWICSNWPVPLPPLPLLQTHRTPAAHTSSSLCHSTHHPCHPPLLLPRCFSSTSHPSSCGLYFLFGTFFSLPITCLVSIHILWRCRFCCVTLRGEPRPQPMCTLLLNLCRRWAALAGNPTVIVSRLGDPDHKAGLARHEMAFPCCSASDQTCRGETHLDKVHKRPWEQRVQVTDVLRKPVEDSSWEIAQGDRLDDITVDLR